MRILGFSQRWSKLEQPEFTTFRYPRMDRDWGVGETVQIVVQPRRKGGGDKLGIAKIVMIQMREFGSPYNQFAKGYTLITEAEARADGFENLDDMAGWMHKAHGQLSTRINKLTLRWNP